jgi:hypothetical protein
MHVKIAEQADASGLTSVTLTGIDSTYDVYMVKYNNVTPTTNNKNMFYRITVGGVEDDTANYDQAGKLLRSSTPFSNNSSTNLTQMTTDASLVNTAGISTNNTMYLFNFPDASEQSYVVYENVYFTTSLLSYFGGFCHTVAQAADGMHFYLESGDTFQSGSFAIYGLNK